MSNPPIIDLLDDDEDTVVGGVDCDAGGNKCLVKTEPGLDVPNTATPLFACPYCRPGVSQEATLQLLSLHIQNFHPTSMETCLQQSADTSALLVNVCYVVL